MRAPSWVVVAWDPQAVSRHNARLHHRTVVLADVEDTNSLLSGTFARCPDPSAGLRLVSVRVNDEEHLDAVINAVLLQLDERAVGVELQEELPLPLGCL